MQTCYSIIANSGKKERKKKFVTKRLFTNIGCSVLPKKTHTKPPPHLHHLYSRPTILIEVNHPSSFEHKLTDLGHTTPLNSVSISWEWKIRLTKTMFKTFNKWHLISRRKSISFSLLGIIIFYLYSNQTTFSCLEAVCLKVKLVYIMSVKPAPLRAINSHKNYSCHFAITALLAQWCLWIPPTITNA